MPDDFLDTLKNSLNQKPSKKLQLDNPDKAAVALCFYPEQEKLNLLMIRRAISPADPWSGQMAFPGGRMEDSDINLQNTAEREVFEEIGVHLQGSGELLGELDEVRGRKSGAPIPLTITPFVYWLHKEPIFNIDTNEVHSTQLLDFKHFFQKSSHSTYKYKDEEVSISLPCIDWSPVPIWGISYLMLKNLSDRLFDFSDIDEMAKIFQGDLNSRWADYPIRDSV